MYFPTKNKESDATLGYWLASPSAYGGAFITSVEYNGYINCRAASFEIYNYEGLSVRPVVYLPSLVTLTPDATTANLWNIHY